MEETANTHHLCVIQKIELVIGAFCGVQVDALLFALNALRKDTILSEAEIIITSPPLVLYCLNCKNEYSATIEDLICPGCLKADFEIKHGQEMLVKAIHGEKETNAKNY